MNHTGEQDKPRHPAVVTLAALHGAGGSIIGPRVAERLGVRFLDRAMPAFDERPRSAADRLAVGLARVANSSTASEQAPTRVEVEERRVRAEIEEFMAHATLSGGVVLGRGGAVVLANAPGALHVYLGGPTDARIAALMEVEGADRKTSERAVKAHDQARRAYVEGAYGVDGDDPSLYHLMIDATAFGVDECVDLIVAASRSRTGR